MKPVPLAAVILGLGVCFGLGMYCEARLHPRVPALASPPGAAIRTEAQTIATLLEDNHRLAAEVTRLRNQGSPVLPAPGANAPAAAKIVDDLRVLTRLQAQRRIQFTQGFVARGGKLTPAFVEVFGLSTGEQASLQEVTTRANEQLAERERANATVEREAQGNLVIRVAPFPTDGGVVYKELLNAFAKVLGPERNEAFMALAAEPMEREMGGFGLTQRVITLQFSPGAADQGTYTVNDEKIYPQGERSNSQSSLMTRRNLTEYLGSMAGLLPENFAGEK